MKPLLHAISICSLLALPVLSGCTSNDNGPDTTPDMQSLYDRLGGSEGVARLAEQWGASIARNSGLNEELDSGDVEQMKAGLANDIMRSSGMTPTTTETLGTALADEDLDEEDVNALSNTIREAGASLGVDAVVMNTVASTIVEPAARNSM